MASFEPKQFGKYYLMEKLAVGGMAEIYKAKTFGVDGFEKQLALKRILPHCSADKEFISMLIDEAKLSVVLSHANIVQVYDLGKVGEDYFISMEFINGPNLRDIIYRCRERNIEIPPELAVYIISEMCKGLDYAHRKTDQSNRPLNLVHRDISPQNILISYEGEVKIVDFGIAKAAMNISHTMAGILKGKIAYMSPEQALGKPIDNKTDIFSAGIVLYEALTQKKLYTGESQFEVLKKIRTTRMDTYKLPDDLPPGIKTILARALAYYPKDRYQSAGEMQTDLTKFLYQTFIDFTPQKLATFVKDLFRDDLKRQQSQAIRESSLDVKTSSINIAQEALQENLVHRDDTGVTIKGKPAKFASKKETTETTRTTGITRSELEKRRSRVIPIILLLLFFAAAGFSYWKWLHPALFKESPTTGTAGINSTPPGANIFIDGQESGLSTPAILEDLELNRTYSLKLKKGGYADLTHTLFTRLAEPMTLNFTLSKDMGTLNLSSEPDGAKIFINKEDIQKTTPSTVSNLELNKDISIVFSKDGYKDFEQRVTLTDKNPTDIKGSLEEIAYSDISVTSEPAGAEIYLDGQNTGKTTPATIYKVEQGKPYTIRLRKDGYEGFTKTGVISDKITAVTGTLLEIKKEAPVVVVEEPKKEEPKEEPKEPAALATLHVSSSPEGAAIYLAGKRTGLKTPATLKDLKVKKTYSIKLVKSGFESWVKKVYIESTKPQNISGTLKKETVQTPAPKPEPKPKPEPRPEPKPEPKAEPKEIPATGGTGTIQVSSKPSDADVFINGELRGKTPASISVPSGSVKVLVNKDGYMRHSVTANVGAGQTTNLGTVQLAGLYGDVNIETTPRGANVTIDGQNIGKSPVTVRKVRRDQGHNISISMSGYSTWSRSFRLGNEAEKKFNVTLEKE